MPTSIADVLHIVVGADKDGLIIFEGEEYTQSEHYKFEFTREHWTQLGKPAKMRIRIEDSRNDPNREW